MSSAAPLADGGPSIIQPRQTAKGIEFAVKTQINGANSGTLKLLIAGDEQHPQYAADEFFVRLTDVLDLLRSRMNPAQYSRLSASKSAHVYVTLNELRSLGMTISFSSDDHLIFKAPQ